MSQSQDHGVEAAATRLLDAARTLIPCDPVRGLLPDSTAATGYAVQTLLTRAAEEAGRRVVGRKIGLTSVAVQTQLGVDQPDFGVLFADAEVPDGGVAPADRLLQPKVEAEIAFVLGADLADDDLDEETVRRATRHVVPALEIVDSRIAGWDITFVDTVADNASGAMYVLGGRPTPLSEVDLPGVRMEMRDGAGELLSRGTGADCLGDPVLAVLWLARTCRGLGVPLRAGEVILSGALGPMVSISAGGSYTATLSSLGSVSVAVKPVVDPAAGPAVVRTVGLPR
ncbi:fumarylacetoacetate hydrolase family protein [Pseudonocardia halophobica]|uniref:Hydratase/decarboxylase n=1 Tax=Pseudonocardia halophobica TaxID=29401 RepID=A0A9W6P0F0_9PSEU|nr:fumarylacetoacetate hydrolase family protein [Pseudonocardia halophobica]GLL15523.1 putative hydratase/decarboxylase [Pseudonocardia halophobica]